VKDRSGLTLPENHTRSRRRLLGAVGAVALALALSSVVATGAATARPAGCARSATFDGTEIQVDNCAGNDGKHGWVWIHTGNAAKIHWADVDVTLDTGVSATVSADRNKTNTDIFVQHITKAKICNFVSPPIGFPRIPVPSCSVDIPF
jgi:hypothetical protein